MTIYMNSSLLAACNQLHAHGYGVELSEGKSGNNHTTTIINIGIRLPGELAYAAKVKISYTTSYGGQFEHFMCGSEEFGELQYFQLDGVDSILVRLKNIKASIVETSTGN